MNQKTDPMENPGGGEPKSFSNKFILLIALIAFIALLAVILADRTSGYPYYYRPRAIDSPLVFPWLNTMSGMYWVDPPAILPLSNRIVPLAGILVVFILCPTVFLFGWRGRRLERAALGQRRTGSPKISSVGYLFCGMITLCVGLSVGPMAVYQHYRYKSSCENDEARLRRYIVQNEIDVLTANAYQYSILPKSAGGGGGSYVGYSIPEKLASTDHAEYTAKVQKEMISLRAESVLCATDVITLDLGVDGVERSYRLQGNWGSG